MTATFCLRVTANPSFSALVYSFGLYDSCFCLQHDCVTFRAKLRTDTVLYKHNDPVGPQHS